MAGDDHKDPEADGVELVVDPKISEGSSPKSTTPTPNGDLVDALEDNGFAIPMLWLSWAMLNWGIAKMLVVWTMQPQSYGGMMGRAFGSRGRLIVRLFILLQQCGGALRNHRISLHSISLILFASFIALPVLLLEFAVFALCASLTSLFIVCCTYFVFIATNISSITGLDKRICVVLQLCVHCPSTWVRDIKTFRYTNLVSNAMIVVCIIILVQAAIRDDVEHTDTLKFFNSNKFYEFVGTATFAWEGMPVLALPLQISSHKSTRAVFPKLFFWTTFGITAVYTVFAMINLAAYGADTETDLLDNLETTSLKRVAQVVYSLAIVLTFPLQLHEAVTAISDMVTESCPGWRGKDGALNNKSSWIRGSLARTALVTVLAGVSIIVVNDLPLLVSVIGSLLGVPLAFIFPSMIYWRLVNPSGLAQKVNFAVIFGGVFLVLACFPSIISNFM